MSHSFRSPSHPFIVPMLLTLACGGGHAARTDQEAGAAGESSAGADSGSASAGDGSGGRPDTKPSQGGSGGSSGSPDGDDVSDASAGAGGVGAGGEAGAGTENEPPPCVSTGADIPDDDFIDSNCDGIDGDVSRAVFVSPKGTDGADGSLTSPLRRIDDAIELAASTERDVYVCNATYWDAMTITRAVAVYGGYDCERAGRRTKDRAVIQPDRGVALVVQNVPGKVHLERLAFRAADAVLPGESSQAGSIVGSADVELSRVEFSAGQGAAGKPGARGVDAPQVKPFKGAPGGNAAPGMCNLNSMTSACQSIAPGGFDADLTQSCVKDGVTLQQRGGSGGAGANVWLALGQPLQFDAQATAVNGEFRAVGTYRDGGTFKPFDRVHASQTGEQGAHGADATLGFGSVTMGLYAATNRGADSGDGGPGYPGVGGIGGPSMTAASQFISTTFYVGSGGGQGGVGGCGGKGALGGGAGGGSVALVVDNSGVSIELSQFITNSGGAGKSGEQGGKGQPGGDPGDPGEAATAVFRAAAAGEGGDGGDGGHSGAGAGGPSIGIAYVGPAPALSENTFVTGAGGPGGISKHSPKVVNGISSDVYPVISAARP